jgi:hypothetical protein
MRSLLVRNGVLSVALMVEASGCDSGQPDSPLFETHASAQCVGEAQAECGSQYAAECG